MKTQSVGTAVPSFGILRHSTPFFRSSALPQNSGTYHPNLNVLYSPQHILHR